MFLIFVAYPVWQLQHVRVDCELRLRPGTNELTVALPDKLHSLLLATRGEQNTLPLDCIALSGHVLNQSGVQVQTIDYHGPPFVEYAGAFANFGHIPAKGKCRILLDYANTNRPDIPIYLLVTKVK